MMLSSNSKNPAGIAIWGSLLIAACAIAVCVVFAIAPLFGSGAQENFVLFRLYGIRRGVVFITSAQIAVTSLLAATAVALLRPNATRVATILARVAARFFRMLNAAAAVLENRPVYYWAPIVLLAAYVNWVALIDTPWLACLNPDSAGYFSFGLHRTIGYTLMVMGASEAFGTVDPLVPLQLNLLIGSFIFLANSAARLFGSRSVGLILTVLLVPNTSILMLYNNILTEPMFVVMITLHLGVVLCLLRRYTRWLAFAAGVTIGCAILIRPAGYSFLACIPIIAWVAGRYWRGVLFWSAAAAGTLLIAASSFNYASFGVFATQSVGGLSLVGHVAHLIKPDMKTSEPELAMRIAARTAPIVADLHDLRVPHDHWMRTMNVYNLLLWQNVLPEIDAETERRMPNARPIDKQLEVARIATELAFAAILNEPRAYISQVISHYYGIWSVSFLNYGTFGGRADECFQETRRILIRNPEVFARGVPSAPFLDPANSMKFEAQRDRVRPLDVYWQAVSSFQLPVVAVCFVLSIGFGVALFFRGRVPGHVMGVGYAAYAMQAYFVLIVGVQAAIPRYAVVMEPYLVFVVVGGLATLLKSALSDTRIRLRFGLAG